MCGRGTLPGGGRCKSTTFYAELTKCAGEPHPDADYHRPTLALDTLSRTTVLMGQACFNDVIRTIYEFIGELRGVIDPSFSA